MNRESVLAEAAAYARKRLEGEASGHDWWHIKRVSDLARSLAEEEGADVFICVLAALLHDLIDDKLFDDPEAALAEVISWMKDHGITETDREHIVEIITGMSFKGGGRPPMRTKEGRVVQDADRLDAIGAVGIARVFAYSGARSRPIHDPELQPRHSMTEAEYRTGKDTAVNHFYEKLLKLKDLMNTSGGKRRAEGRHRFLEQYLEEFYHEWEGRL